jgi:outer membrane protein
LRIHPRIVAVFVAACAFAAMAGAPRPARAQAEAAAPAISPTDTLDLDACVRIALERQPSLRSARATADASHARVGTAVAGALPDLSVSGTVHRSGSPGSLGAGESDVTSYSSSFSLRQRLFDMGVTLGSIRSAKASAQASDQGARAAQLDVIQGVEAAYFGLLKAHRLVEVAQESRDQLELHLKQAQAFYTVGTHARYDVTKAEADLTSAELGLIKARNNERLAAVVLATALGLDTGHVPPIRDVQAATVDSADARLSLAEAERTRPDLLAAQAKLRAAGAQVTVARGGLFPTLDASVSYGWQGPNFPLGRAWSAGLTASMPIFDGLATVRRVQEASASERASQADYADLLLRAREDVESAVLNLNLARDNIAVTRKLLVQAQENFDVAEGRYKAGAGSIIDLADAQLLLTSARTQDVQARYDLQIARSTWLRALGRDR